MAKLNLSNYKLFSCDMGELVPIGLVEVLPGDRVQHAVSALVRLSPQLAPVMHPVHCKIHTWYVPHRLVWDDWEEFITGGDNGNNASVFPTITFPSISAGSLANYLGLPISSSPLTASALPLRAYAAIWNEWYRDQDLQTKLTLDTSDGVDTTTNTLLQNVAWEKDYFTSARPWPQKGPEVMLPLGSTAPVVSNGASPNFTGLGGTGIGFANQSASYVYGSSGRFYLPGVGAATDRALSFGNQSGLEADLSASVGASVNDARLAFALQRFEENRARYGSRYTEYLRQAFGVRSSDARLQRPEYLGGGKETIQFSEVLQTAEGDDPVGSLKGHGLGAMRSNRYRRYIEEHGYIISFMSVKPKTMYTQGIPRTWNRRTREDFFQKELQHIGQQEILNKELYAAHAQPDGVFGYQDRYDEYRRQESSVAGEFATTDLDFWHMARIFGSTPALNADFIKSNPTKRVFAVQSKDVLWVMASHNFKAVRPVSAVGNSYIF